MRTSRILFVTTLLVIAAAGLVWANYPRAATIEGLGLDLDVRTGDITEFTFTATNASPKAMSFEFSSGQQFDIIVYCNGRKVWQWSDGQFFTQALIMVDLEPGGTLTFTAGWEHDGPGTYTARAIVLTVDGSAEIRKQFEIQ